MEKEEKFDPTKEVNAEELIVFAEKAFYNNCKSEKTYNLISEMLKKEGSSEQKLVLEIFNIIQKIYCQGMQHGAAMTVYGGNSPEIREKILKATGYDEKVFDIFFEITKEYLKVV